MREERWVAKLAGMNANQAGVEALIARLREQPELAAQVAALLDEIENRGGTLATADAAENTVVARVRLLGQAALTAWAQRRCAQLNAERPEHARRGGKKNSAGRRPLVR